MKTYQLGFIKANHSRVSLDTSREIVYNFQSFALDCDPVFLSTSELGFGVASLSHFCYLCIKAEDVSELKSDIDYCLIRAEKSNTPLRHEVCFCVSYFLGTCFEVC